MLICYLREIINFQTLEKISQIMSSEDKNHQHSFDVISNTFDGQRIDLMFQMKMKHHLIESFLALAILTYQLQMKLTP
jgi:hypothetical protein